MMRRVTATEALERLYLAKVALIPRLLEAAFADQAEPERRTPVGNSADETALEVRGFLLACVDRELEAVKRLGHRLARLRHGMPLHEGPGRLETPLPGPKIPPQRTADGTETLLARALADAQRAIQAVRDGDALTVDLLVDLVGEERQACRDLQTLWPKR